MEGSLQRRYTWVRPTARTKPRQPLARRDLELPHRPQLGSPPQKAALPITSVSEKQSIFSKREIKGRVGISDPRLDDTRARHATVPFSRPALVQRRLRLGPLLGPLSRSVFDWTLPWSTWRRWMVLFASSLRALQGVLVLKSGLIDEEHRQPLCTDQPWCATKKKATGEVGGWVGGSGRRVTRLFFMGSVRRNSNSRAWHGPGKSINY